MPEPELYTIETIPQVLTHLQRERFYGALELKFENGHLVCVKKTQTFVPRNHREGTR